MTLSSHFTECTGCEQGDAFYAGWAALRPAVLAALGKLDHTSIYIGGHDTGGALATLASYDLSTNHGKVLARTYTFGSPRVGNRAFASAVNDLQLFRVTHHTDSVVHQPPREKGYYHSGLEVRCRVPPAATAVVAAAAAGADAAPLSDAC
jgi:hypothetical protein